MVAAAKTRRESNTRGCEYHNWIRSTKDVDQLRRVQKYHTDTTQLIEDRLRILERRKSPPPTRHDEGSDWGLMAGAVVAFVLLMAFWSWFGALAWGWIAD